MKIWAESENKSFAEMHKDMSGASTEDNEKPKTKILETEIPMLFTEEGHIVCIDSNRREELKVGFFGTIRSGKSLLMNRYFNRMFWIGRRKSIWLNDVNNESFAMGRPMTHPPFLKKLYLLGEQPIRTPIIHLFPHVKNSTSVRKYSHISAEICFDFNKVLDKPEFFFNFEGSQKYFNSLIKDLRKCKSVSDVEVVVSTVRDPRVRDKIWSTLSYLFEHELFNFNNKLKRVYCKGTIIDKNNNLQKKYDIIPGTMLMRGCVALHTHDIVTQEAFRKQYTELILRDIYELQRNDDYFKSTPTHIAIDEIWSMSSKDNINETIREIARVGTLPIGLSYASQSYIKIDPILANNTRLSFVFGFKNKDEAKLVADNYGASNSTVNNMLHLNRDRNECILLTDEKLSVYDPMNNEKYFVHNEAIKGIAIPPPSNHKIPSQNEILKPLIVG